MSALKHLAAMMVALAVSAAAQDKAAGRDVVIGGRDPLPPSPSTESVGS